MNLQSLQSKLAYMKALAQATDELYREELQLQVDCYRDVGLSYRDIAYLTGISYQRAQQIAS